MEGGRGTEARTRRYRATEAALWGSLGVRPRESRVRLPAGNWVRIQELGDGAPVLFLHGASTCGTSWAGLASAMPTFRSILVDRPGTGLSDPLAAPIRNVEDLLRLADRFVLDLLDTLGIDRVDLVVSSFGALFGFRAALSAPDRVGRVAALGWPAVAPAGVILPMLRIAGTSGLGSILARLPLTDRGVRTILASIGLREALTDGRVSQEAVDCFGSLLRDTPTVRNDLAIGDRIMGPRRPDPRLVLPPDAKAKIRQPVLLVWGDRDPFGSVDIARDFAAGLPDASLNIVPAGHAPWMELPHPVAALVRSFLEAGGARGPDSPAPPA